MEHVVLESADFDFTPYSEKGDSGLLLLGLHRPTGRQYIVKHAYPECACNEFMYYVIGTFLGDRIPQTNLIRISHGDKRPYQSHYLVGSMYLKAERFVLADRKDDPGIVNQWVVSEAITEMLSDHDGSEYIVANNNELYRIDTTAAFCGNSMVLMALDAERRGFRMPSICVRRIQFGDALS